MQTYKARLIVPQPAATRDHITLRLLETDLAKHFGGFTATNGRGVWVNAAGAEITDRVRIYEIATECTINPAKGSDIARELAEWLTWQMDQDCVYVEPFAPCAVEFIYRPRVAPQYRPSLDIEA